MNFTSTASVAKQNNVNSMVPSLDNDSNYALATALKQAGVKLKAVVFATGYEPSVIHSPAWSNLQGDYFMSLFRPFSLPNAGTEQMQAALRSTRTSPRPSSRTSVSTRRGPGPTS